MKYSSSVVLAMALSLVGLDGAASAQTKMEHCKSEMMELRQDIAGSNFAAEDRDRIMAIQYSGLHHCRIGNYIIAEKKGTLIRGLLRP